MPAPPRDAFVAFTSQLDQWWDPLLTPDPASFSGVDLDPRGEVAFRHGKDRHVWGEVTEWDPGTRLSLAFWLGHSPDHPTTVAVTFTAEGRDKTRVRLEHGGWTTETADARDKYGHWNDLLARYAAHVAR